MKAHGWFKKSLDEVKDTLEYKLAGLEWDITEKILEVMETKNISRADLARSIGVTKPTITRLFRDGSNMTLKRMLSIAEALDCDLGIEIEQRKTVRKRVKDTEEIKLSMRYQRYDESAPASPTRVSRSFRITNFRPGDDNCWSAADDYIIETIKEVNYG